MTIIIIIIFIYSLFTQTKLLFVFIFYVCFVLLLFIVVQITKKKKKQKQKDRNCADLRFCFYWNYGMLNSVHCLWCISHKILAIHIKILNATISTFQLFVGFLGIHTFVHSLTLPCIRYTLRRHKVLSKIWNQVSNRFTFCWNWITNIQASILLFTSKVYDVF